MADQVTIGEQIACVARELAMRRGVYPKWVAAGRMKQAEADKELARMDAVLETLIQRRAEIEGGGGVKNRLSDLNNHLFAQLERLGDEDLDSEKVELEARRADAIVAVSDQVLRIADIQLKAAKIISDNGGGYLAVLPAIGKAPE